MKGSEWWWIMSKWRFFMFLMFALLMGSCEFAYLRFVPIECLQGSSIDNWMDNIPFVLYSCAHSAERAWQVEEKAWGVESDNLKKFHLILALHFVIFFFFNRWVSMFWIHFAIYPILFCMYFFDELLSSFFGGYPCSNLLETKTWHSLVLWKLNTYISENVGV